jgi:glutathione S-transferase
LEVSADGGEPRLLSSSTAIAQYLAATGNSKDLLGKTAFERAQVDMWLQVIRLELQPLTRTVSYQAFGHVDCDMVEHLYVYGLLTEALKIPNNHLKGKTYFVGGYLTIVDVFFTLVQQELQQGLLDTNYRNSMSNINNHFKNMAAQEAIKKRCGAFKQGKKQIAPILLSELNSEADAGKDLNKQQKKENSKQKATKQK